MKKLNNHIKNIAHKTANLPLYWFIPLILLLSYILVLPFAFFDDGVVNPISEKSISYRIVVGCLLGPVLETLLHQALPIYLFTKKWIKNRKLAIFISALFFGLMHSYSLHYILWTFVGGLLLAWAYLIYYEKYGFEKAFWAITIVHALRNAITLVMEVF